MNIQTHARAGGRGTATADLYPTRQHSTERWLDRHEPTVWQEWQPDAPLSRAEVQAFDRDGFLVLHGLFEPDEVQALIAAAARMRADGGAFPREDVITEPGSDAVRTIFRIEDHDPTMARLAADARLAGIARFLLGDEVYIHQSRLNDKSGFDGKPFYWHSDFETWHAEDGMPRMRAVSASLLLTDNCARNGALMLMPGSHRVFVSCAGATPRDNHLTSLKAQTVGTPSRESLTRMADRFGIADAEGPAGTLVLFDCNTMHGSNGNITPAPRANAFFVYNAVSNALTRPFAAQRPRPRFLARREPPEPIRPRAGTLAG